MALKSLLLKKELDGKRSSLAKLEARESEFETRTAEITAAINEMTEDADEQQREAVSAAIEQLDAEKAEHKDKVGQLREEIERLEQELADAEKEQEVPAEKEPEERTKQMDIITRDSKEYIDAYAEYIKGNKKAAELRSMFETRSPAGGSDALLTENAQGTVPVPTLVYDLVKTAWENEEIMNLVRKTYLRGNIKVGFEISAGDAVVHIEGGEAVSPEELILGIVELVPSSIKKVVQVSDEALDMGGEEFLRYIYDELTHKIAKKAADLLIAEIAQSPTTSSSSAPAVAQLVAATITVGTIAQAIALLSDEAANPVIVMNKATWGAFKAAQAANGYNYDPFEGLRVVFNNSMKTYATAGDDEPYAIVGDFANGALANFPNGQELEIKLDTLSLKKQDLVEVLGRKYVALGVIAPNAFVNIVKTTQA